VEARAARVGELEAQSSALLQQAGQVAVLRESSQLMSSENARLVTVCPRSPAARLRPALI
jgi:hypothetical protein